MKRPISSIRMTTVVAHEIGGHIEHFTAVHMPDTGIEPDMNDQKKDQENTRKAHDEFLAYGRCKEFRPFHINQVLRFAQPRKFSTGLVAKSFSFAFFGVNRTG